MMYYFLRRGINGRGAFVSRDSPLDPDLPEVNHFFLRVSEPLPSSREGDTEERRSMGVRLLFIEAYS